MNSKMYENKKVLLIGGGGTLGTYTAKELLRLGCYVDIVCLEDKVSDNERMRFYKEYATMEFLSKLLQEQKYDGIVNFIYYPEVEDYKPFHKLLSENTGHLIFLSSYRIYADLQHPVTEDAPILLDTVKDEEFLKTEKYALSKARCEKYIREESGTKNYTIVRPVISFSEKRFDLVTVSGREIIEAAKSGKTVILPQEAKNLIAGLDWAGNSGKLIANLLFKEACFEQAYTVSSAQNLTWGEVADIYAKLCGLKFRWTTTEEYVECGQGGGGYILFYDRLYDRTVDNQKILNATGLKKEDFTSIEDGIKIELGRLQ